jgi:hypothetical protein
VVSGRIETIGSSQSQRAISHAKRCDLQKSGETPTPESEELSLARHDRGPTFTLFSLQVRFPLIEGDSPLQLPHP